MSRIMRLPTRLRRRKPGSHKGDFGHILIIAGSKRFSGAGVLCAEAALRSGAGLVTWGLPVSLHEAALTIKPKELMTLPLAETAKGALSEKAYGEIKEFCRKADVLAIGPGLSQEGPTQSLIRRVVSEIKLPMVIDADGLNAFTGHLRLLRACGGDRGRRIVLTPHPGEMARLTGSSTARIQKKRAETAKEFVKAGGFTLVLKGRNTVVADPGGGLYVNRTGNPGMATAGSGDVLTGIIASFLGQGLEPFEASKYAVYLHGLAGDLAAKEKTQLGLIASDIIGALPAAIRKCS